jgi:glycosyltransferase involved in cell wall biosynthesis
MEKEFKPLLSVITVVFNNVKHVQRTINSVTTQSYSDIEYIVIDGVSTDGTLEIINRFKTEIDVLISEPDNGIYDAMNKGLKLAKGDYVVFMNSGDEFYEETTVEQVFKTSAFADIYYGETEMLDENLVNQGLRRHRIPDQLNIKSFRYGMSVSHQAIFIKKSITKNYNPKYLLSADIDWILDAIVKAEKIVNTQIIVAKYLIGGMSKKRHLKSLKERYQIFKSYYGFLPNFFNHVVITKNLIWYYLKHGKSND